MSRLLGYVIVASVVVFPIAAILYPQSWREMPVSGGVVLLILVVVGGISGMIVGLLGGVVSGLLAKSVSALLEPVIDF